jgi:hypothetical protein
MVVKGRKEAEDPLMQKWKEASLRKSSIKNFKLRNKSESTP